METLKNLWLPKLFSDGMVLANSANNVIYGKSCPHDEITIHIQDKIVVVTADQAGVFRVQLGPLKIGGPYTLKFIGLSGGAKVIEAVYVGATYLASGQSNMELPMSRVKVAFESEWLCANYPEIRMFKVCEAYDFHDSHEDYELGEWVALTPNTIDQFSATAYFMAKAFYEITGEPIGIIQNALGGSPIQAWMPRNLLLQEDIDLLKVYEDDDFVRTQMEKNNATEAAWMALLNESDQTIETVSFETSKTVTMPNYFSTFLSEGYCGSVWLKKTFTVENPGQVSEWILHLGTLADADAAYINGHLVGETGYQYPPRWYQVASHYLKKGLNQLILRVIVTHGDGRLTPGKPFFLKGAQEKIDLSDEWAMKMGERMGPIPPRDFIAWKPTGLHNAMLAPCFYYGISGVLWYQGESNTKDPSSYKRYLSAFVDYIRDRFHQANLPFVVVQLANFDIDLDPILSGWPEIRLAQLQVSLEKNTGLVVSLDAGESNDLHPLDKKTIGERICKELLIGEPGPYVSRAYLDAGKNKCVVTFKGLTGNLGTKLVTAKHSIKVRLDEVVIESKTEAVVDGFVLETKDQRRYRIKGNIQGQTVVLDLPVDYEVAPITTVYYCHENNPIGNLLYDSNGKMVAGGYCIVG